MNQQQLAEEAAIRANLYRVISAFFLQPPTAQLLEALAENPVSPVEIDDGWELEQLVQEHHDLFQVPLGNYVFPYESCYRGRKGDKPGQLMGKPAIEVQDFYQRAGLGVSPEARELPDHAGIEFAMLQVLAEREADAWREGAEEVAGRWQLWQSVFLERHICRWIPELCDQIRAKTAQPYFERFAAWVRALASDAAPASSECPLVGPDEAGPVDSPCIPVPPVSRRGEAGGVDL